MEKYKTDNWKSWSPSIIPICCYLKSCFNSFVTVSSNTNRPGKVCKWFTGRRSVVNAIKLSWLVLSFVKWNPLLIFSLESPEGFPCRLASRMTVVCYWLHPRSPESFPPSGHLCLKISSSVSSPISYPFSTSIAHQKAIFWEIRNLSFFDNFTLILFYFINYTQRD